MDGYCDLRNYALIGDCYGSALVCRDGSIDWCCLERFDADPIFSRILDKVKGGHFSFRVEGAQEITRRYRTGGAILETVFSCGSGSVTVTDFMALSEADGSRQLASEGHIRRALVRLVSASGSPARIRLELAPRRGFSGEAMRLAETGGWLLLDDRLHFHCSLNLRTGEQSAQASWSHEPGEVHAFLLTAEPATVVDVAATAQLLLADTERFWAGWRGRLRYGGRYKKAVERSAVTLKLMMYLPTGAMVAAPTTSLPEEIGGIRNWDYRFCWPRDASFAFYALEKLGEVADARDFFEFFHQICAAKEPPLPPLFSIDGTVDLQEREIEHFDGYAQSRPVRCGNEAAEQHQTDVYGQLLDLMYLSARMNGAVPDDLEPIGRRFADFVAQHWRDPDAGLWEPRLPNRRHVHSAVMCWVALDRAIRLFGDEEPWVAARDAVLADIAENAVHPTGGYLTQVFGGEDLDAAVLIAPMVGLPLPDGVLARTVDAVTRELGAGPLVYRYRNDDGLPGEEGTFLVCAFWLIDALLVLGRVHEARQRFEALLDLGNDVGLYPEEMDPDGTFLGNFPQAFTHLGLVHTALLFEVLERSGPEGLHGTYADRAIRLARLDDE